MEYFPGFTNVIKMPTNNKLKASAGDVKCYTKNLFSKIFSSFKNIKVF